MTKKIEVDPVTTKEPETPDVFHSYCCDENTALCGHDISGEPETDGEGYGEVHCKVCEEKYDQDVGCGPDCIYMKGYGMTTLDTEETKGEEMTINIAGEGWYEFIKHPEATTHIIHVGENSYYVPEEGVDREDFFAAVKRGQAYKLVRVEDVEKAWGIKL